MTIAGVSPVGAAAEHPKGWDFPGSSVHLDDAVLVERLQRDDDTAFRLLYARHARYVAGVAYRLLGTDGDLDDIVQDTFVDAAAGLRELKDPTSVRSWLAVVAVRKIKTLLARRRRWRWFSQSLAECAPIASNPNDRRMLDDLYEALDHLPVRLRVPWVLHRMVAESLPEVAALCETSLATVKRRIAEAEERLRRRLDAE